MKKNNWALCLHGLGAGVCCLFGSSVVYADMQHSPAVEPQMSIIQDNFNTEQKLNLSIYNPRVNLMANGQFSQPMGFYVYTNSPDKIAHYHLALYRANDKDLLTLLKPLISATSARMKHCCGMGCVMMAKRCQLTVNIKRY